VEKLIHHIFYSERKWPQHLADFLVIIIPKEKTLDCVEKNTKGKGIL